jgi:hypothetical protein
VNEKFFPSCVVPFIVSGYKLSVLKPPPINIIVALLAAPGKTGVGKVKTYGLGPTESRAAVKATMDWDEVFFRTISIGGPPGFIGPVIATETTETGWAGAVILGDTLDERGCGIVVKEAVAHGLVNVRGVRALTLQ